MKSEKTLVKVRDIAEWRGDDLRFRIGSADADRRGMILRQSSFGRVEDYRVEYSADDPTHAYDVNGRLARLDQNPRLPPMPQPAAYSLMPWPAESGVAGSCLVAMIVGAMSGALVGFILAKVLL